MGNFESLATAFLSRLVTAVLNFLQKLRKESSLCEKLLPVIGRTLAHNNRHKPKVTFFICAPRIIFPELSLKTDTYYPNCLLRPLA